VGLPLPLVLGMLVLWVLLLGDDGDVGAATISLVVQ